MKPEEFNAKMGSLRPTLLRQARRLAADDHLAEDLVQETLLSLWAMGDRLDRHPNAEALALATLRNKHTDAWRRQQTAPRPLMAAAEPAAADNRAEARGDIELVSRILDTLPPLQAQIFRLKEIEGYDRADIRQITGCSDESLRQNLSRARRHIIEVFNRLTSL